MNAVLAPVATRPPFQTVVQIIAVAKASLDARSWNYLEGGAGTEGGLRRNAQVLDAVTFRPRGLRDVSAIDTSATLLGQRLRLTVFLSPIGSLLRFHAEGSRASATRFGTDLFYGVHDAIALEDLGRATPRPAIFQLYVRGSVDWACSIAWRAQDVGFRALWWIRPCPAGASAT